jgi:MerC mercury resistance protein
MRGALPTVTHAWLDQIGIGLSFACAIHCMALPLLVAVLPLTGLGFLVQSPTEALLVLASPVLAAGSLCWGFRLHRRWHVFVVLSAALVLIGAGRSLVDELYEIVLMVAGALLLVGGHLMNRHLCRSCLKCQTGEAHGPS